MAERETSILSSHLREPFVSTAENVYDWGSIRELGFSFCSWSMRAEWILSLKDETLL